MKRRTDLIAFGLIAAFVGPGGQARGLQQISNATESIQKTRPPIPQAGRVTDMANILSANRQNDLTTKLEDLERVTRHQMVVVTVASLGGQEIASFTAELAKSWGVGRNSDSGVVLLVAPNEQMVRIAVVGEELQTKLTKEVLEEIINDTMTPQLRAGDLPGGIEAGLDALIALLR